MPEKKKKEKKDPKPAMAMTPSKSAEKTIEKKKKKKKTTKTDGGAAAKSEEAGAAVPTIELDDGESLPKIHRTNVACRSSVAGAAADRPLGRPCPFCRAAAELAKNEKDTTAHAELQASGASKNSLKKKTCFAFMKVTARTLRPSRAQREVQACLRAFPPAACLRRRDPAPAARPQPSPDLLTS